MPEPQYSAADLAYLRSEYRTVDELCADRTEPPEEIRQAIVAGRLPAPTYVLYDGTELFPRDFFALMDAASGLQDLPAHFHHRHQRAAADTDGDTATPEHEWANYLSGLYGACLREVTPEAMVAKEQLVRRIETMTKHAQPEDQEWERKLREAVDALDVIERPFTDYDRERWGGTSRDTHITAVREKYL